MECILHVELALPPYIYRKKRPIPTGVVKWRHEVGKAKKKFILCPVEQDCAQSAVGRDKLGALLPKKEAKSQRTRSAQLDKWWHKDELDHWCLIAIVTKVRKTQKQSHWHLHGRICQFTIFFPLSKKNQLWYFIEHCSMSPSDQNGGGGPIGSLLLGNCSQTSSLPGHWTDGHI